MPGSRGCFVRLSNYFEKRASRVKIVHFRDWQSGPFVFDTRSELSRVQLHNVAELVRSKQSCHRIRKLLNLVSEGRVRHPFRRLPHLRERARRSGGSPSLRQTPPLAWELADQGGSPSPRRLPTYVEARGSGGYSTIAAPNSPHLRGRLARSGGSLLVCLRILLEVLGRGHQSVDDAFVREAAKEGIDPAVDLTGSA